MRFCLLNTFFPPMHFGGGAIFIVSLANLLARAGHEVEVVHCADSFHLLQGAVSPSPFPLHGPRLALRGRAGADVEPWLRHTHWHNGSLLDAPAAFRLGTGLRLMTLHEYWLICTKRTCYRCAVNLGRPPQFWRNNGLITNGLENSSLIYPCKSCRTFCRLRRCRQGSERITT